MSFNQYTWDLYKQTTIGIEMIKYFSDAGGYVLFKDYCPYANFIPEDLYNDWLENIYCYGVSDYDHPSSLEEANPVESNNLLSCWIRNLIGYLLLAFALLVSR